MKGEWRVLSNDKKVRILLLAAFAGLCLAVIGSLLPRGGGGDLSGDETPAAYGARLEKKVAETVSAIEGAGRTSVLITFENTFETVYATNASIDEREDGANVTRNTKKELAGMNGRETGQAPVVVKKLCPKIRGVLIVCEGGGNDAVAAEVTAAVSTALGVAAGKIRVTRGA